MTDYGLLPTGFVPMRQSDCISDLQNGFIGAFGQNVDLSDSSVFGQIVGIMAERYALLWEALQDTYNSQYPSGAEGVSVDNLLSLSGIQRLAASPTKTNKAPLTQANGIVLHGLVVYGTPGTTIPQGSIVQTSATPPVQFSIDGPISIGAAVNALQQVVFSNTPTQGVYALAFGVPSGAMVNTYSIPFNAVPQKTFLAFIGAPSKGSYVLCLGGTPTAAIPYSATADVVQSAIRAIGFSGAAVDGLEATGLTITWGGTSPQPFVTINSTTLQFGAMPASGSFTMAYNGQSTPAIQFSDSVATMQGYLRTLTGAQNLILSGAIGTSITFAWGQPNAPSLSVGANSLGVSLNYTPTLSMDAGLTVTNSIQAHVNQIIDPGTGLLPFTDVAVTSGSSGFNVAFGANAPLTGNPSSAAQAEPAIVVASNTLQAGQTLTNLAVFNAQAGQPALGLGSATCTSDGPNVVAAGALNAIGTPIAGWSAVTNQLDCITGSTAESDTDALTRRNTLLATKANGPLDAIVEQVRQVTGVTAALGFANMRTQAEQVLTFASVPTSGSFILEVDGELTPAIAFSAGVADVQAAIQALPDFSGATVTGSVGYGFTVDFAGALGGQAIPLMTVAHNTTGVTISARYGRPGKSVEIVVEGGADQDVAQAIYDSLPAGVSCYGSPIAITTGSYTANSASMTVASSANMASGQAISGRGIAAGTMIGSVSGNTLTLSQPAVATYTQEQVVTSTTVTIQDADGNPQLVGFSRPQAVPIYISVNLVTDYFNTPGNPASGVNPYAKFSPQSAGAIQENLMAIGNAVPIGGTIVAQGTQGLVGCFNNVLGIISYTLNFGTAPNPTGSSNLPLQPQQVASVQSFNVSVSFT